MQTAMTAVRVCCCLARCSYTATAADGRDSQEMVSTAATAKATDDKAMSRHQVAGVSTLPPPLTPLTPPTPLPTFHSSLICRCRKRVHASVAVSVEVAGVSTQLQLAHFHHHLLSQLTDLSPSEASAWICRCLDAATSTDSTDTTAAAACSCSSTRRWSSGQCSRQATVTAAAEVEQ